MAAAAATAAAAAAAARSSPSANRVSDSAASPAIDPATALGFSPFVPPSPGDSPVPVGFRGYQPSPALSVAGFPAVDASASARTPPGSFLHFAAGAMAEGASVLERRSRETPPNPREIDDGERTKDVESRDDGRGAPLAPTPPSEPSAPSDQARNQAPTKRRTKRRTPPRASDSDSASAFVSAPASPRESERKPTPSFLFALARVRGGGGGGCGGGADGNLGVRARHATVGGGEPPSRRRRRFRFARIGPSRLRPRLRPRPVSAPTRSLVAPSLGSPPQALDPRAYEYSPPYSPQSQSARRPSRRVACTGASILRTIRDGASDSRVRTTVTTRVSRTRRRSGTARTPLGRLATGLFTRRGWTADRRGEAAGGARPRRSGTRRCARTSSRSRRGSDRARARCWWVPAGTVSARRPGDPARRGSTDAAAARSRSDPRLSSTRRAPAHVRAWLPIQSFAIRCGVSSPRRRSARPADAIPRRPPRGL